MSGEERQQYTTTKRSARLRRDEMPLPTTQTRRGYVPPDPLDYLAEDDPDASRPPRPGSSAIRLNDPRLTGTQRALNPPSTTRQMPVPYPYRRSGQQPVTTTASPAITARMRAMPAPTAPTPQKAPYKSTLTQREKEASRRIHWLLFIGVGMLVMLALWVLTSWLISWGTQRLDDIRYGNPRTYQTDAVVGHGGDSPQHPSHFIAINLHGHIIVVELMAGDPAKAITYGGPYLYGTNSNVDQIPPILEFKDVNGDGKPDMIIHLGDQNIVFINTGTKFRPSDANDKIHL